MAQRGDYDKYYSAMPLVGCLLVLVNLYYFVYPLLAHYGLTAEIADLIIGKLWSGGVFVTPYRTKLIGMALIAAGLITQTGNGTKVGWMTIVIAALLGAGLYLCPRYSSIQYIITTCVGAIIFGWAVACAGRKFLFFNEAINDRNETFRQSRKIIKTEDSINIPMKFQYKYRIRKGWINVINPYRATMVLGTPGSGKSFSVYGPFIEQMIAKGFSMFIYDYKFPDLTDIVYNEYLLNLDNYKLQPEFCVINFNDPRKSLRCNPINPLYIKDPADTTEIAELVMLNVNKAAVEKEDFFTLSAKVYLDALLWFLKVYENGKYCTFPHVIELMAQDYKKVFTILSQYRELEVKIKPFSNALEGGAQEQLQGQIASAQIPLNKFVSPSLYWVLTGDDFTLDINDPLHPKILCVGNDPDRQAIYGTTLALFASRMFKLINHKGKQKCGVLLDELPTIYFKGIDNLIATARSNKVAIVLGAQDKSQLRRDYGEKESEVIFNTVGNIFSGQVNGKTAEELSRSFGNEFRKQESETRGYESDSITTTFHLQELLPLSTIETLSQGVFFGKVADNNDTKIKEKFFCGEIQRDLKALEVRRKNWTSLPRLTDFGEEEVRETILKDPDKALLNYFKDEISKGVVIYDEDDLNTKARESMSKLNSKQKAELVQRIAQAKADEQVDRIVQENFKKVQEDIKGIVEREYTKAQMNDRRMVDAFAD